MIRRDRTYGAARRPWSLAAALDIAWDGRMTAAAAALAGYRVLQQVK